MLLPSISLPQTEKKANQLPKRKLLKHLSGNDYCLEIDNSTLELMMNCDRRFQHGVIAGRIPAGASSPLVYGSAVHSALEKLYRDDCRDIKELYKVIAPHFEESPPAEGEWRTLETCVDTIQKYLNKYPSEPFAPLLSEAQIDDTDVIEATKMVEVPFAIPLTVIPVNNQLAFTWAELVGHSSVIPDDENCKFVVDNLHIVWTGKIDIIAEQDNRLGIVDHKTSSVVTDAYWKGFELSQQFMGYWWSAEKLLGREISWALVNCIKGGPLAKTPETRRKHELEMFQRRYYYYRRDQIDNWPNDVIALCEDLVHRLIEGFFPKKTTHCVAKFGLCPFHPVCTEKPEHQEIILNSNLYSDATWNPLN